MGFSKKIKKKLFPDEEETLFYHLEKPKNTSKTSVIHKPISFQQTQSIAGDLKNNTNVILDISELNKTDALKMINFLGGVIFALNGEIKRNSKIEFEFIVNKGK